MMAAAFGVSDLDRIVAFAKRFPVFPCRPDTETVLLDGRSKTFNAKSPRVGAGFHAASQDERQIRSWWRQWPDSLVGVPTGQGTGLVVVDYDPDKATSATHQWIADHTELLCSTRSHKTARGGMHYLFQSRDRYQTGTDLVLKGSPRKGIDLRANGGYVIWWPLHGFQVNGDTVAPVPADLIDERRFNATRDMAPLPKASPAEWSREAERVADALLSLTPDGYEFWIRVGMALHHASGGSDAGFDLWHDWSSRGETYDGIEDCRYHWASFGGYSGRSLGLGTIYAAAKATGWTMHRPLPEPPDVELPPVDAYHDEAGNAPPINTESAPPLVLRPLHEIVAERREPEWLIDDVLEANVMAVLAGPRSSFKSFVALDWGMRIAVAGQPVVILSGEGAGLDRRADAWLRTHGNGLRVEELPVFALERPLNLNQDTDLVLLKGAIERLGRAPALVIVDTFSKFSAGLDENDNGEVSTYLARLSLAIRQAFGSTVLLVAHSGHGDSGRPRGASALMANPDAEYIIARPSATAMTITVSRERFKDSPSLPPIGYEAQVVELGRNDRRGRPVTSLALAASEAIVTPAGKRYAGVNQERAVTALRELHRANPACRFLTSQEIADLAKAQGINRKRRLEVVTWLVAAGILTPSVGGHAFDPTNL